MAKVFFDITVSLDGYVAGPDDGLEHPLGVGGERLHEWIYGLASWREPHGLPGGETGPDSDILGEATARAGAVVLGKRMFDNARGWGDNPPFHVPVFVLTHTPREPLEKEGGTTFTFVTDGIESAVEQARAAAGRKDVAVGGGASTIQQALAAGLVDDFHLHLAPVLLGGGVPLFDDAGAGVEVEPAGVVSSAAVAHLRYRIRGRS